MSGNRGCVANSLLFLVCVFVPLVGHIIETVMVFEDDYSLAGTILWLVVIWGFPFIGPFLYLLLGQRQQRVMFGQPNYVYEPTFFGPPTLSTWGKGFLNISYSLFKKLFPQVRNGRGPKNGDNF